MSQELDIIEVLIEDSLGQLAKTCTLTLAPSSAITAPVAEFGRPGDTPLNCATDIRPNGIVFDIVTAYGGLIPHVVFSGSIEYMDDLDDADKLTYKIVLSEVPRGFPHKQKRSGVWNMTDKGEDSMTAVSSRAVLSSICGRAGIALGRCDFPNYNIWGTYEVAQQSPIDVAQALYAPFNISPHLRYFTRVDRNGLHVIAVHYGKSSNMTCYEPAHLLSRQSHYEVFIPEITSNGDILLTGGDRYTNKAEALGHWEVECYHTYYESAEELTEGVGTRNSEKWSDFTFNVELTIQKEVMGDNTVLDVPSIPSGDIDNVVAAVKNGDFDTCTILDSFCTHIFEQISGTIRGKYMVMQEKETNVTYEEKSFRGSGAVDTSFLDTTKIVPTFDEMVESHTCGDGLAPTHMTRNWYFYDDIGSPSATVTAEYYYARGWHLAKTTVQSGENMGLTNAQIQFYLNAWNAFENPPTNEIPKQGVRFSNSKTPLCKYMLLNGSKLEPLIMPKLTAAQSFTIDEKYWQSLAKSRAAKQISGPGMDYSGLGIIWGICIAAMSYHTSNYYWHVVAGTYSLDTTPVVGELFKVGGATGICEAFKHIITENEATTNITLRRLVQG